MELGMVGRALRDFVVKGATHSTYLTAVYYLEKVASFSGIPFSTGVCPALLWLILLFLYHRT